MSSTVDNRVVQMKFDNKDFENNVKTSMNTLQNLNKSLDRLDGAGGLTNLAKSAKGVTLDQLAANVETIAGRFTTLGIVGVTALQNIANSAVETGKRMLESLTIDPVRQGLGEYELKMGSVQTIMSSTGADLQTVNRYLGELNEYADKTIYSFSDMTSSIGKFTNNGVELEKAVKAIQGISNEAALSGANAQQASHAMYNFAQALSSGSVKLIDWKSIENANMATVEFKQELLDTALELGTVRKEGDKYVTTTTDLNGKVSEAFDATSMFNDSLAHQWMTSEVLINTLGRYADETTDLGQRASRAATEVKTFSQLMDTLQEAVGSGWAETFELIFGDFNEAKALWSKVNDEIGAILDGQAKARNDLLKGWKDLGGRAILGDSIQNAWEGLLSVLRPIRDAFRDIFPAMTAQRLYDLTAALRDLTAKFKISDVTANNLRRTFRGLFAIFDIAKQVFVALYHAFQPVLGLLPDLSGGFLGLTAVIGDGVYAFDQWLKNSEVLEKVAAAIAKGLQFLADKLRYLFGLMANLKSPFVENSEFLRILGVAAEETGKAFAFLYKHFSVFVAALAKSENWSAFISIVGKGLTILGGVLTKVGSGIISFFKRFGAALADFSQNYNTDVFADLLGGGFLAGFIYLISLIKKHFEGLASIRKSIVGVLDEVRNSLQAYQQKLKADIILEIAIAIGILAAALAVLSLLDTNKLSVAAGVMAILFGELVTSMLMFNKFVGMKTFGSSAKLVISLIGMIMLASAVVKMAKAMQILGEIDPDRIKIGMAAIGVISASLMALSLAIGKAEKSILAGSIGLILMAQGLKVMIKPVAILSDMAAADPKALAAGLIALQVLMLQIVLFLKAAKNLDKLSVAQGSGILLFAVSLRIMASAIAKLGDLSIGQMVVAMLGMVLIMATMVKVFKALDKLYKETSPAEIIVLAGALVVAGFAMNLIASAIKSLGDVELWTVAKGIIAFGIAFKMLVGALNKMPKEKAMGLGLALLMIGKALKTVAEAVIMLGQQSLWQLAKGLGAIVVSLGAMVLAINLLAKTNGAVFKAAAALAVLSFAILLLAPALKLLGTMSVGELVIALAALAGALLTIGLVAKLLAPTVPFIIGLGIGIALLASSFLIAGTAVLLFAKACSILGADGLKAAAAVTAILMAVIELIPLLFVALAKGIGEFFKALAGMFRDLVDSIVVMIKAVCDGLKEAIPYVAETVLYLLDEVLKVIAAHIEPIAEALMLIVLGILRVVEAHIYELTDLVVKIIINFINALANNMPEFIQAAVNLISQFFAGIMEALRGMDTSILVETFAGIGLLSGIMIALAAAGSLAPAALVGVAWLAIVIAALTALVAAFGAIAQIPGIDWLLGEGSAFLMNLGKAIGGFIGGIVGGLLEGATATLPSVGENLSGFMENAKSFIEGAKDIPSGLMKNIEELAGAMLVLTGANIVEGLTSWLVGKNSLENFGKDLEAFAPYLASFGETVKGIEPAKMNTAARTAVSIAEVLNKLPKNVFSEDTRLLDFGKQLEDFAPSLVSFSEKVKDITPEDVDGAINAAKMISEMAKALPNSGGVLGFFAGENDLSAFGKQLPPFGLALKMYAGVVKDITPDDVDGSVNATRMLSDLAHNLPNDGGVLGFFTGNNSLGVFGKELASFGPDIKAYADEVKNVKPDAVEGSVNAARMLADLATAIPNDGGVLGFFAGNNSMDDFGKALRKFGKYLAGYSGYIEKIDIEQLAAATPEIGKLVNIAGDMSQVDSDCVSEFGKALASLARNGITKFTDEFKNAKKKVTDTVTLFVSNVVEHLKKKGEKLEEAGKNAGDALVSAFIKKLEDYEALLDAISNLCTQLIDTMDKALDPVIFQNAGRRVPENIAIGISDPNALNTAVTNTNHLMMEIILSIRQHYEGFRAAASYMVDGIVEGLNSYSPSIVRAGTDIGNRLLAAVNETLGISSPSKEGYRMGRFVDLGIANGLRDFLGPVIDAADTMGGDVIEALSRSLSGLNTILDGYDYGDPVITPVLDLSNIEDGASRLGHLLDVDRSYQMAYVNSRMIEAGRSEADPTEVKTNNEEIVTAVNKLRDDFASMLDRLGQLQVVLDNGVLVGELAGPMDVALGTRSTRNRRERGL